MVTRRTARRARDERGSASIELMGIIPYLLVAALLVWQLLLVAMTVTAAENAARNGSRAASMGGNAAAAVSSSLPGWLSGGASTARGGGNQVTVAIAVPILVPNLTTQAFVVRRDANLP